MFIQAVVPFPQLDLESNVAKRAGEFCKGELNNIFITHLHMY